MTVVIFYMVMCRAWLQLWVNPHARRTDEGEIEPDVQAIALCASDEGLSHSRRFRRGKCFHLPGRKRATLRMRSGRCREDAA